ncbi:protease adaptor protein RcdA [Phyllobacterium sp. K27]
MMGEQEFKADNTIRLADRMVRSGSFNHIYDEGMNLVEEAAAYLDGQGRDAARLLSRTAATLYAAESMRLTTRLMQVASWLLLQRASRSGEMTLEQVMSEKAKVRLDTDSAPETVEGWDEIPLSYCDIVHRSLRLQARVRQMDDEIYNDGAGIEHDRFMSTNPVSDQISLLATAFGHR